MVSKLPRQQNLDNNESFLYGDFKISPLAIFDIEARVLSREDYRFDRLARLSPVDFALGWGNMSDESVLDQIKISQSNRWYRWRTDSPPIPLKEIKRFSGNMHLIPANSGVEELLTQTVEGDIVNIGGYLVQVESKDGWRWRSSLTRNDTGSRACELIWVEKFEILIP